MSALEWEVEAQGPNECALVCIAAIAYLPLREISAVAREIASARGKRLALLGGLSLATHSVLRETAWRIDPTGRIAHLLGLPHNENALETGAISGRVCRALPLHGRGAARLYRINRRRGHLVLWSRGFILTPERRHLAPLAKWRAAGWKLHYYTIDSEADPC